MFGITIIYIYYQSPFLIEKDIYENDFKESQVKLNEDSKQVTFECLELLYYLVKGYVFICFLNIILLTPTFFLNIKCKSIKTLAKKPRNNCVNYILDIVTNN